ncbi:putative HTH araC/xylS-type domain-containing protein [Hyphomicrobiales bacterium]|nr:putative HTH araC/xylS-type domain-containing protein [Hyphomicrobiales bacterium]CAH1689480.1 putative HTH araC/xylS-type domain-containing protein [Hyphomicrobiales bacterium]
MPELNIVKLSDIAQGAMSATLSATGNNLVEIEPGLFLGRTDFPLEAGVTYQAETMPFAALSILLEGTISTAAPGMEQLQADAMLTVANNERRMLVSTFTGARRLRNVEVFVIPDWFEQRSKPVQAEDDFAPLHDAMRKPLQSRRAPLPPRLRMLAHTALDLGGTGAIAALKLEAWTLDLLAELVTSFHQSADRIALPRIDYDRVRAIRELIESDPGSAGGIGVLAQRYGVSASKLKRDFFLAFGSCIGGFISEQRLVHARYLLEQGMAVSQAAYNVGYTHPANFSAAFKKRYGVPPRSITS